VTRDDVLQEIANNAERLRDALNAADHAEGVVRSLMRRAELLKAELAAGNWRKRA
jgi:hypothetical protein